MWELMERQSGNQIDPSCNMLFMHSVGLRREQPSSAGSAYCPCGSGFLYFVPRVLDFLRIFIIKRHQTIAGLSVYLQEFIQLGVNGLRVAVFGALDEERHCPSCKRRGGMPV